MKEEGSGWRAREGAPLPCPPPHALPGQQWKQDARVACSHSGQQPAASSQLVSLLRFRGPSRRPQFQAPTWGGGPRRAGGPLAWASFRATQVCFCQTHKSPASVDVEPSFQIPGLARRGASIHVRASVIHVWVWVKYSPAVFTSGDVNCVPLLPDEGASEGVDEGAAAREVAAVWGKASRARRPEGPGVVKGGEPGILCVSGPSVFWGCQQEDAGGQGRDLYVEKTSLVFLSYRCPGGEGTASALLGQEGLAGSLLPRFPGWLAGATGWGGKEHKVRVPLTLTSAVPATAWGSIQRVPDLSELSPVLRAR